MRENWLEIDYRTVVNKITTNNKKLKQKEYLVEGKFPVIDQGQEFVGGYTNDETKILDCQLPVLVFGDHTKIVKLVNYQFAPGADGTKVLEPKPYFEPKLLQYFTQVLALKIKDKGYARHYQDIEKSRIPLPPSLEQKAIVGKIEELFSELDNGIENLKTALAKLKIYRQAVLKKAFEGEFTREWRERQNNPKTQRWCQVELKEIIKDVTQGWSPKCLNEHSFNHEEWAVIKTSAIQHNAFLEYENKILPTHLVPKTQHELKDGDILITRAGPRNRVGVCCLIENIRPRLINCDKAYRLRLNNEKILNKFFILKINSHEYIQKIDFIKTGGSDSGLNLTQTRFLSLEFSLPSLEEQTQIIQEIESRLSVCDKIEETITNSLAKAESLRQSILKKAFDGNLLTQQELETIHNHPDYESAEELLKRIKKERQQS